MGSHKPTTVSTLACEGVPVEIGPRGTKELSRSVPTLNGNDVVLLRYLHSRPGVFLKEVEIEQSMKPRRSRKTIRVSLKKLVTIGYLKKAGERSGTAITDSGCERAEALRAQ
jgi:hypothetical protein